MAAWPDNTSPASIDSVDMSRIAMLWRSKGKGSRKGGDRGDVGVEVHDPSRPQCGPFRVIPYICLLHDTPAAVTPFMETLGRHKGRGGLQR